MKRTIAAPRIPEGFRAVPIHETTTETPLRLCVFVREVPDPVAGHFICLRDLPDAQVYLGGLTDAADQVVEWMEVWVQNVEGLEASLPAARETFSNHSLDRQWTSLCQAFQAAAPNSLIQTGWESRHPLPTFIALSSHSAIHPSDPVTQRRWELCQSDAALQAAGLPAYSTSLFRYLYQPGAEPMRFVPMVAGAPQNEATQPLTDVLESHNQLLPFNPQGGLLRVARCYPIPFDHFADLLGGKPWEGIMQGKKRVAWGEAYAGLEDWANIENRGAYLFLGAQRRSARFLELLHLKLQLLAQAFLAARSLLHELQLPFLNLSSDSFRVRLEAIGTNLPLLWTARCALVTPSQAHPLPVAGTEHRYFIRLGQAVPSIYAPEGLSQGNQGQAQVRIRKVLSPPEEGLIVEGTLALQDRLSVSPNDLIWIRLPLASGRLDLYGHLYSSESLAQGEVRFRTLPQRMPQAAASALSAAEGVSFARSVFEIVPQLSSPCDLYAMAVVAVRTLLVNEKNSLAVALDDMLSLARQVGVDHAEATPLESRIRSSFEGDSRWQATLGPHQTAQGMLAPAEADNVLPAELWYEILATIIRLFPGAGPDSICRDFGDVPALALETVFDRPLQDLRNLVRKTRSLIVIDWNTNREIHSVIHQLIAQEA